MNASPTAHLGRVKQFQGMPARARAPRIIYPRVGRPCPPRDYRGQSPGSLPANLFPVPPRPWKLVASVETRPPQREMTTVEDYCYRGINGYFVRSVKDDRAVITLDFFPAD